MHASTREEPGMINFCKVLASENAPLQNDSSAKHDKCCALEPPEKTMHPVAEARELWGGDWGLHEHRGKALSQALAMGERPLNGDQRLAVELPARTAMLWGNS